MTAAIWNRARASGSSRDSLCSITCVTSAVGWTVRSFCYLPAFVRSVDPALRFEGVKKLGDEEGIAVAALAEIVGQTFPVVGPKLVASG